MLTWGALSFAAPWLLLGLAALPVLWWLLRLTPPSPKQIPFPAIRLLFGLQPKEETPDRTPWWLILLRLVIAALLILGLAHPLWNAARQFQLGGPLLLVIDDGWAAAAHWPERMALAQDSVAQAGREGRNVALLATAPQSGGEIRPISLLSADQAAATLAALKPSPWPVDRALAAQALAQAKLDGDLNIVWLSDGLAGAKPEADQALAAALNAQGKLDIVDDGPGALPLVMLPPELQAQGLVVKAMRATSGAAQKAAIRVLDGEDRTIAVADIAFPADALVASQKLDLPIELRGRASQVVIEGAQSASGVALLDDSSGRKPIGVITDNPTAGRQPLLGELYYVERALAPGNEVRIGDLDTLIAQPIALIILPDQTAISAEGRTKLAKWVERGGMLIRFAGERLAAATDDNLLPVRLRQGDRVLGGALSWAQPTTLTAFPAISPFAGLEIPHDVHVERQVLAEPELDLGQKTWARLADGTPLVTGAKRGEGYSVLFHVTANAEWSDLALSGLFVDMLDRLVQLAAGVPAGEEAGDQPLKPVAILDGFGRLGPVTAGALPILPKELAGAQIGPLHPPGFYGPDKARRGLNLGAAVKILRPLGLAAQPLARVHTVDFKPWMIAGAFLLLLLDLVIALRLRGLLTASQIRAGRAAAGLLLLALLGQLATAQPASAQPMTDDDIIAAMQTTHLAFVRTGVPDVDATSRAGLNGLTSILLERTSTDVGDPVGVDLEADDLTFYPLLYWPMTATQRIPSARAIDKLNKYIAGGGLIFFDTADQNVSGLSGGSGPGVLRLQELTAGLDVPPLAPIAPDHVLTRAFYLLKDFPGRWIGGSLWVETANSRVNDGVATVIVGSNDYAGAWAVDDVGQPMFPVTPGGERQREMAYRFGINLVMYALTGNYKSDQVHVPAILERLGQ